MNEPKKLKLEFAEGCFDGFEGTQEELQELIAHIRQMAEDGTIFDNAEPIDPNDEEFIKAIEAKKGTRQ